MARHVPIFRHAIGPTRQGAMTTGPAPTIAAFHFAPGLKLGLKMTALGQSIMHKYRITPAQAMQITRAMEEGGKSAAANVADSFGLPPDASTLANEAETETLVAHDPDRPEGGLTEEESSGYNADEDYEAHIYDKDGGYGYPGGGYTPTEAPRDGSTYGWDEEEDLFEPEVWGGSPEDEQDADFVEEAAEAAAESYQ
jgi:hypothetical protein